MKFSLILATLERTTEVGEFLSSLEAQTHKNFELIIVDQNKDKRLLPILEPYSEHFCIHHLRAPRGLSRARNVGLAQAQGDVVAFPDDDCQYPPECLAKVKRLLTERLDYAGLTGRCVTSEGTTSIGKFDEHAGEVTKRNVWRRGVSITIFLRIVCLQTLKFDETLGAGATWGSGEETDLLLQVLALGEPIWYTPKLKVIHPAQPKAGTQGQAEKAYHYGRGMGRVLQKHAYPFWYKAYYLLRPLLGSLLYTLRRKRRVAQYYFSSLKGRWSGLSS